MLLYYSEDKGLKDIVVNWECSSFNEADKGFKGIVVNWKFSFINETDKGLKGIVVNGEFSSFNETDKGLKSIVVNWECLLTLFLLGGSILRPPLNFLDITQKVLVWGCWNFLTFLTYRKFVLPLGLKPGFNTNCLSSQAHCLNDCFCL